MNQQPTVINADELPRLDEMDVAGTNVAGDYWTPAEVGESKRVFFLGTDRRIYPDFNDPSKEDELDIVLLLEQSPAGDKTWENASKRLVAIFEDNDVQPGTAWLIKYLGRADNRTNSNKSDRWDVRPLALPSAGAIEQKPDNGSAVPQPRAAKKAKKRRGRPRKTA